MDCGRYTLEKNYHLKLVCYCCLFLCIQSQGWEEKTLPSVLFEGDWAVALNGSLRAGDQSGGGKQCSQLLKAVKWF